MAEINWRQLRKRAGIKRQNDLAALAKLRFEEYRGIENGLFIPTKEVRDRLLAIIAEKQAEHDRRLADLSQAEPVTA